MMLSKNQTINLTTSHPIRATFFLFSSPPSPTPVHFRRVLCAPLRLNHNPSTRECVLLSAVRYANTVLYATRACGVRNRSSGQERVEVSTSGVPRRCEEKSLSDSDEDEAGG